MAPRPYYRDQDGEVWMSPATAAPYLLVTAHQTVLRWCHAGKIGHVRLPFSGHIRISLAELNRLRAERGLSAVTPAQITGGGADGR